MNRQKIIFELTQPGTWLEFSNRDVGFQLETFIRTTISSFYEVNAALWLFEDAYAAEWASRRSGGEPDQWEAETRRRQEIQDNLVRQQGYSHDLYDQVNLILKREQWTQGKLPRDIEHSFTMLHAHGFLYAIDQIGKYIDVIAATEGVPDKARAAAERFNQELPQVRDIRNSAAHREDRLRGLDQRKRPIPRQPINDFGISAPGGGVMVMSGLHNQTLTYTVADGRLVGLDITAQTVQHVQNIIQELLNAFDWKGSATHHPS